MTATNVAPRLTPCPTAVSGVKAGDLRMELLETVRQARCTILKAQEEGRVGVAIRRSICVSPFELWEELKKRVETCRRCPLGNHRLRAVFGTGSPNAQVMWVGEGPGYEEDHRGEPFVGKAGQLLDAILASIGLDRRKVYITNVVKCHPMVDSSDPEKRGNDRPPTPEEMEICRGYLENQCRMIRPKVLVTLGAVATRALLKTSEGITSLRGKWRQWSVPDSGGWSARILPTYHPAALLRNPSLKKDVWQDMKNLKKEMETWQSNGGG